MWNLPNAFEILLDAIRSLEEQDARISAILLSPKKVARGYAFLIEHGGHLWLVVNSNDMPKVLAAMQVSDPESIALSSMPIIEDEQETEKVLYSGVYKCAYPLRYEDKK